MSSKGRPYKTIPFEGYEILVGRGDEENDLLTLTVAEPDDLWLHAAGGVAGSHVVVRNPEKLAVFPDAVVRRAAELAAWHSKARGRARVEVHVCRARDVEKRGGMKAGTVQLRRWTRVRVSAVKAPGEDDATAE